MNELKHLSEFNEVLASYQPSQTAKDALSQTKLVLLVAATGSGRNTIINELLKTGKYHYIVSDTTRQPRVNNGLLEQNGKEYWFRSELELLNDLKKGKFLEAEVIHQRQVSGTSVRELEKARKDQKIAITDIDIGGIKHIMSIKPDTIAIAILPPSFKLWQERLTRRGKIAQAEFVDRMRTALRIFKEAKNNPNIHIIINDDLRDAANQVNNLATGNLDNNYHNVSKQSLAGDLYSHTKSFLSSITLSQNRVT